MDFNDNSVNIKKARPRYHHGDLRAAAVEEGLKALKSSDPEHLSLREIARNIGVSATALYRHFPEKSALLAALAKAGMAQLAREQMAAGVIDGKEGFAASGRAYVRFAIANPGLFRLIFANGQWGHHDLSREPMGSPGWILRENVAALLAGRMDAERAPVLAYRAWALVHGLSMLILDRQIEEAEGLALLDQIISNESVRAH